MVTNNYKIGLRNYFLSAYELYTDIQGNKHSAGGTDWSSSNHLNGWEAFKVYPSLFDMWYVVFGSSSYSASNHSGSVNSNCLKSLAIKDLGISSTYSYFGIPQIVLGSGTKPESADDFTLEQYITNSFSYNLVTSKYLDESNKKIIKINLHILNTSNTVLKVSEIGLLFMPYTVNNSNDWASLYGTGNNFSKSRTFLMERSLLDTPVSLQPNESTQIIYRISPHIVFEHA